MGRFFIGDRSSCIYLIYLHESLFSNLKPLARVLLVRTCGVFISLFFPCTGTDPSPKSFHFVTYRVLVRQSGWFLPLNLSTSPIYTGSICFCQVYLESVYNWRTLFPLNPLLSPIHPPISSHLSNASPGMLASPSHRAFLVLMPDTISTLKPR